MISIWANPGRLHCSWFRYVQTELGGNFSVYTLPDIIKTYYADRPLGVNFYLRLRLRSPG